MLNEDVCTASRLGNKRRPSIPFVCEYCWEHVLWWGGGVERLCVPVSFYFPLLHNLALLALRVHVELRLRLFKKQLILLKEAPRGCVTTNLLPAVVLVHSRRITLLTFHRHKIIGGKILIKNIPWRLTLFSK